MAFIKPFRNMRRLHLMKILISKKCFASLIILFGLLSVQQDAQGTILPPANTQNGHTYAINPAIPGAVVRTLKANMNDNKKSQVRKKFRLQGLISETRQKLASTAKQLLEKVHSTPKSTSEQEEEEKSIESAFFEMLKNDTQKGWLANWKIHAKKGSSQDTKATALKKPTPKKATETGKGSTKMKKGKQAARRNGARRDTTKELKMKEKSGKGNSTAQHQIKKLNMKEQTVQSNDSKPHQVEMEEKHQTVRTGVTDLGHKTSSQDVLSSLPQMEIMVHTPSEETRSTVQKDHSVLHAEFNGAAGQISIHQDNGSQSMVSVLDLSGPNEPPVIRRRNERSTKRPTNDEESHVEAAVTPQSREFGFASNPSKIEKDTISTKENKISHNAGLVGSNDINEERKPEETKFSDKATQPNDMSGTNDGESSVKKDRTDQDDKLFSRNAIEAVPQHGREDSSSTKGIQEQTTTTSQARLSDMKKVHPTPDVDKDTERHWSNKETETKKVETESEPSIDTNEEAVQGMREEKVEAADLEETGTMSKDRTEEGVENASKAVEQRMEKHFDMERPSKHSSDNAREDATLTPKTNEQPSQTSDATPEARPRNKNEGQSTPIEVNLDTSVDNTTQLSLMVYKIAKSEQALSMAAAPCREVMGWMPRVVSQLEIELPGFKFYCVDTQEPVGDMKDLKRAYGDISGGFVQASAEEVGQAIPKNLDLVVSWMGMQKWGIRKAWRFIKGLHHSGSKLVLLGSNPVSSNSEAFPGKLNVRKAPLLFKEPLRIIGNVSMDDSKQLLLYSVASIREGH